jgi:hypothetical protein
MVNRVRRVHVAEGVARPARPGARVRDRMPKFAEDWHPTGNGDASPEMVAYTCSLLAEWRCRRCGHEWRARVAARYRIYVTKGPAFGCRRCSIVRRDFPGPGQSIAERYPPHLLPQWSDRNGVGVSPWTVKAGGPAKQYWWRCLAGLGHPDWPATPVNRRKSACPVCAGRAVTPEWNLAVIEPDLAAQWHPTQNENLRPEQLTPGSQQRVWWRCTRAHEWATTVALRTSQRTACPVCSTSHRSGQEVRLFAELKTVLEPLLGAEPVKLFEAG